MRELVFALEYDPGANPVADALEAHPDTTVRSLSCHVTAESLWRVDHAEGSLEGLEALEDAYRESSYCADCLVKDDCGADCEIQILDRSDETLVVYTYWDRTDVCTSVPHLALEYLGEGLLFETYREGRRYRWRIVLGNGAPVGDFFDALGEEVGDCTGMEMLRLTDVDPDSDLEDEGALPREQRDALRAAVDHGYYETPRQVELSELAEDLGIPRSTLSYRLRRAEAELATTFLEGEGSLEELSPRL
ncbi:helix-turn-helix domain-containing protein [Natrialbaceae archaeon A-gly3]